MNANEKRAERAFRALLKYDGYEKEDMSASIVDLVTDLLHLAPEYGIEPDYIIRVAQGHYNAEKGA